MADQTPNNQASRKDKAEGERYNEANDEAGGITNRPLEEEIDNQEALPERGRTKEEEDRKRSRQ